MIFLTVGTQLPFDRLVKGVDEWAGARNKQVFGQIGASQLTPRFITAVANLEASEFERQLQEATAVVSHAGMGTILMTLQLRKPIVIMPRLAALKEQRNDHQLATVNRLRGQSGVLVAMSEADLSDQLDSLETMTTFEGISRYASSQLIERVRSFIDS